MTHEEKKAVAEEVCAALEMLIEELGAEYINLSYTKGEKTANGYIYYQKAGEEEATRFGYLKDSDGGWNFD